MKIKMGPYKRNQIAAHRQAKFYLPRQAPAAVGRLPWCPDIRCTGVDEDLEKVLIYPGALSTPAINKAAGVHKGASRVDESDSSYPRRPRRASSATIRVPLYGPNKNELMISAF